MKPPGSATATVPNSYIYVRLQVSQKQKFHKVTDYKDILYIGNRLWKKTFVNFADFEALNNQHLR